MSSYVDTGLLCSLYAPDAHTRRAVAYMRRHTLALPFTWLHQLELRNALRLRLFRREISVAQRDASLNMVLADVAAGVLEVVSPPLTEVMAEAERLGATHSEKLGTRSLDILHVASALVLRATSFVTYDRRQAALARASGLKVPR